MTTSVLIASYGRPADLARCLEALAKQTLLPEEVIVVWQGADTATRGIAEQKRPGLPFELHVVHSPETGIVPAENAALDQARGSIVLLVDDDVVAPPEWVANHVRFYMDQGIGGVGGGVRNFRPDGAPFPQRTALAQGKITWFGKLIGNLYDHPPAWRSRPPFTVEHLAAGNMSLRRDALHRFEERLRPYWQLFEADACLQAQARGYRIVFDPSTVVDHYPTNHVYDGKRDSDVTRKVYNAAFNHAFILSKHSPWRLRFPRLCYLLLMGSLSSPGLLGFFLAVARLGNPRRETVILVNTLRSHWEGWRAGARARNYAVESVQRELNCAAASDQTT
jgi:GT2 family glycosyltransferase